MDLLMQQPSVGGNSNFPLPSKNSHKENIQEQRKQEEEKCDEEEAY